MSKLLSIIIPVYKVEAYVEQCLRSCAIQKGVSSEDYEIIVVNDGSPDNSMEICEKVAQDYTNIRLVNQNNAGVSVARNKGLSMAEGDYVWFVDSDDWIEPGCLKHIFKCLRSKNGLDILYIHGRVDYEDGRVDDKKYRCIFEGEIDGPEHIRRCVYPTTPQWSLYRRKFLLDNALSFFPGIYHEDSEFIPRACYVAKRIACLDVLSYHLRRGERESTTSTFRLKNALDTLVVIAHLHEYSKPLPQADKQGFYRLISRTMNNILFGTPQLSPADRKTLFKELKQNRYIFDLMSQSGSRKYRMEAWFLKHCMPLAFRLYQLVK